MNPIDDSDLLPEAKMAHHLLVLSLIIATSNAQFLMPFGKFLGCFKTDDKGAAVEAVFKSKPVEECQAWCRRYYYRCECHFEFPAQMISTGHARGSIFRAAANQRPKHSSAITKIIKGLTICAAAFTD